MMEQSNSHYKPGDQIKVVLKSPQNVPFRGLMVQAIDPESGQTIGSFSPGRGLKTIDSVHLLHIRTTETNELRFLFGMHQLTAKKVTLFSVELS
uniref:Reelin domain-containing protein n=1 Tax=Sarcoptes scabiei TaxID=52283 RepID=A0A834V9W9_SARSC